MKLRTLFLTFILYLRQLLTFNKKLRGDKYFIFYYFQSIGEELVSLEKGSIEGCQSFIKKHSQNLHPNHYYLMVSFSLSLPGSVDGGQYLEKFALLDILYRTTLKNRKVWQEKKSLKVLL